MAEEKKEDKKVEIKFSTSPVFSWEAPEFVKYKKDKKWFFNILGVAVVLIAVFALQKLWSAAIMVGVATLFITTLSGLRPRKISCAVYPEGVVVDKKAYSFQQFKSFWVTQNEELSKFYLQLLGRFGGQVVMPSLENSEQIRLYLSKHMSEENMKNDIGDILNRLFRI